MTFRPCDTCGQPTSRAAVYGLCEALATLDDDEGLLRDDD